MRGGSAAALDAKMQNFRKKKPRKNGALLKSDLILSKGFNILGMPGDDLLSHSVVPSALERFTVEFEMGSSGGAPL